LKETFYEAVKEFMQSDTLRQAMTESGVTDQPTVFFLQQLPHAPL